MLSTGEWSLVQHSLFYRQPFLQAAFFIGSLFYRHSVCFIGSLFYRQSYLQAVLFLGSPFYRQSFYRQSVLQVLQVFFSNPLRKVPNSLALIAFQSESCLFLCVNLVQLLPDFQTKIQITYSKSKNTQIIGLAHHLLFAYLTDIKWFLKLTWELNMQTELASLISQPFLGLSHILLPSRPVRLLPNTNNQVYIYVHACFWLWF